jgi:HEPN domain-containing protein
MHNKRTEWLKQADYDMETAKFMVSGQRYFYAVFMCHMAVEKALKGLYLYRLQELPPKTHNLIYLLDKIGIRPDEQTGKFIARLSEANIATRYPEDLERLQTHFTLLVTARIVDQTKDVLEWIKKQF